MPQRSLVKAARAIRGFARCLVCCLEDAGQSEHHLTTLSNVVARTARVNTRKRNPSHWQLLQNPELLNYALT
jgi:hypothetical protein